MTITLERDTPRRRLLARATGRLTLEEALTFIRTARASPDVETWPLLFDACGATTTITPDDVERLVGEIRNIVNHTVIPRGHVALVADDDVLFERLLLYETRTSEIGVRIIR